MEFGLWYLTSFQRCAVVYSIWGLIEMNLHSWGNLSWGKRNDRFERGLWICSDWYLLKIKIHNAASWSFKLVHLIYLWLSSACIQCLFCRRWLKFFSRMLERKQTQKETHPVANSSACGERIHHRVFGHRSKSSYMITAAVLCRYKSLGEKILWSRKVNHTHLQF